MNKKKFLKNHVRLLLTLLVIFSTFAVRSEVFAEDATGIVTIFCNVINEITGGVGKVISILILISMAIGLFLGKITWGLAIAVMVGMGLLFGATKLVDLISEGASTGESAETLCAPDNKK
jgi:type IV secretion system protein VirB2